jgi:hypothetical protein|tara:strand:+ start:32 stop:577 length:546 start_codon:yes stop_codon:yes gene_type:complete
MFFYDHAMSDEFMMEDLQEREPMGEIDMMDGLRAMALFKRSPGPLQPMDISQDVKEELSTAPSAFMQLCAEGFISDALKREVEQMIKDRTFFTDQTKSDLPSSFLITFSGEDLKFSDQPFYGDEIGGPKKKKKSRNIPTNPKLYARVKAEAKRKFDVYPSAYANAWLVRTYKKRGGGYRKG